MNLLSILLISAALPQQGTAPANAPSVVASTSCPQTSVTLPTGLDRVLRDYEVAWSKGDAKGLAALFSEDGFVMSMGGTPVRGRVDIERRYTGSGGSPLSLRAIAFSTDGSTGFILGCYAPTAKDPDIGKFTLTLKKDPSGRWLIFSDMDNPNARRR